MEHLAEFCSENVTKIHNSKLEVMKQHAIRNKKNKRFRLCMHSSPEESLHEMLICRTRGDYVRPDKHKGISESHTIIEGTELIILFSDEGTVIDAFLLDRDKGYLSYRINSEVYHMTIPVTDFAVDMEVKPGPFDSQSNIFPPWAPDGKNERDAMDYLNIIEKQGMELISRNEGGEYE